MIDIPYPSMTAEELADEIDQLAALLAHRTSPASAAKKLRETAYDLDQLQPRLS